MYVLASNMWFTKLMKQFFFWIDKIVFNFISLIYDVMISIARTSVFSQSDIVEMADRIYKLLAIFMVFKVTFSLITYVVNPDDFSDKSKGVSKLGINIIICMSLLILTPYVFSYAYQFQTIILEDNSLGILIFGGDDANGENANESFFNTAGDKIAYTTMVPFFTPNTSITELVECTTLLNDDDTFNSACSSGLDALDNDNFSEQTRKNYIAGVENGSLGLMFRQDLAIATYENDENETEFIMDYKFIFSTVTGIIIILLLISFCMDIAVRSIKLSFLQLIAPIPIISYVDPKSGKDGLFKKWYEMCFKTFLSLFVRLIALYFAVFIISKVADLKLVDVVNGSYVRSGIISIFIIIGALMFAKQLPKMLEGLGIKLDSGSFTLNPLKKLENEAIGGKMLKKPNEALAKFGKGALRAPLTAASLGGRKLMAGVDSATHGKGFWNGTKNVKGKLAQSKDKFMEKNLPHTSKAMKDKKEARDEIKLMHNKWKKGEKVKDALGGNFDSLNGLSREAYRAAGFGGEFLESKKNLDHASERQKVLQDVYNARQMGQTKEKIREELGDKLAKYGLLGKDGNDFSILDSEVALSSKLNAVNKEVAGLEKVHESWRKSDQKQAELEDSIKFNKYNPIDPTNPTYSVSSSNSSNEGSSSTPTSNSNYSNEGSSSTPTSNSNSSNEGSSSTPTSNSNSSNEGSSSTSLGEYGYQNSSREADNIRENIKKENEAKIEQMEKQIENIKSYINETREFFNKQIETLEKLVDQYKEQRREAQDVAIRDAIDKKLDATISELDAKKAELKKKEEYAEKQIEFIKKQIEIIKNGV